MKNKSTNYRVVVIYKGYSSEKDQQLFDAAGSYSNGSGCGLGERDHEWYFTDKKLANACATRLRKVRDVSVSVEEDYE